MKQKHFFDVQFDFPIVGIVSALLLIGILSVYVAVSHDYPQMVWSFLGQQLAWIGMGCFICLIVTIFNTKFLWQITPFLYVLGLALMVLPLIFYNPSMVASTGAKNWVAYGNITLFQPSEFMKIPFILMLSRSIVQFLQRNKGRERLLRQDWFLILELTIYTIPVFVLLALQQDLGTALVFMAIFAGLVLVSGVSWKIILPVVFVLVGGVAGFLFLFLSEGGRAFLHQQLGMPTYQMNRILAWLNPFDSIGHCQWMPLWTRFQCFKFVSACQRKRYDLYRFRGRLWLCWLSCIFDLVCLSDLPNFKDYPPV